MNEKKFLNKFVHVDFIDENDGGLNWTEGILTEIDEVKTDDKDSGDIFETFIEVESDNGLSRISMRNVRTLYIKEK